jgi:outer membrane scaffolding protein for murein synthesis (MipA/OmpV family)
VWILSSTRTCIPAALGALLAAAPPAHALDLAIALGTGHAPDDGGWEDHRPVPFWNLRLGELHGPTTHVDILGPKLTSNLIAHPHLRLGPMVELILRRGNVDDDRVDRLEEMEAVAMLGGLLGWYFVANRAGAMGVEVQARADIAEGHGYLVTPALKARGSLGGGLSLAAAVSGTLGIDARDAVRGSLGRLDADAGFKDAGIDLVLGLGEGDGWQAGLIGRYRRLLEDAADSPIAADEDDEDQLFAGLLVGCRF